MPLLGLQYAFFYIALIETSNLELILGGHPADVTGMHENPCATELIAQLVF